MTECNCIMKGDWDGTPAPCHVRGPKGDLCSKPAGHDGPHAACNVAEHPVEVWE